MFHRSRDGVLGSGFAGHAFAGRVVAIVLYVGLGLAAKLFAELGEQSAASENTNPFRSDSGVKRARIQHHGGSGTIQFSTSPDAFAR